MGGEQIRVDESRALAREVEGEIVILDMETQRYIGGNSSVAVLWPLLERGTSETELAQALREKFGIGEEQATRDIEAFLASLGDLGLLA